MLPKEMMKVLALVREMYPTFLNGRNEATTFAIWMNLFDMETCDELIAALNAYACRDTKGFPPPIGALKELVWQQRNERMSEQTAWELVRAQLCGSSAHPRDNFDKLPDVVKACVGTPYTLMKWGQMDESELETVIASNFKRTFREMVQKKREHDVLPANLQARFAETVIALPNAERQTPKLLEGDEAQSVPCPPDVRARVAALFRTSDEKER